MLLNYGFQCVKGQRLGLEELKAFEDLLEQCSKRLGLTVRSYDDLFSRATMVHELPPYAKIPEFNETTRSNFMKRELREQARLVEVEKANAKARKRKAEEENANDCNLSWLD